MSSVKGILHFFERGDMSKCTKLNELYSGSNAERVGATLAVALIQGGDKPRPYNVGIMFLW